MSDCMNCGWDVHNEGGCLCEQINNIQSQLDAARKVAKQVISHYRNNTLEENEKKRWGEELLEELESVLGGKSD